MTTVLKKRSSTKKAAKTLKLTSRDINMLSAIAQQTDLPSDYLLKYAKRLKISQDAYGVLEVLVKKKPAHVKTSAQRRSDSAQDQAARVFQRWASDLKKSKEPTFGVAAVRKAAK